jgi:peptide deformylase
MVREIVLVPDPRLNMACEKIEVFDENLRSIAQDLEDTMRAGVGSVGVAAPQIGEMVRVAVVDTSGHRKFGPDSQGFFVLVNPEIIARDGERTGREGCMSLPDFTANVKRSNTVTVKFQTLEGEWQQIIATDFEAVAMQHEIDHLDGILFLDRVSNLQTDVFPRKKK